ncbi:MAG: hypothetical protein ABI693_23395 [Bryobacteraceae bacterium]
MIERLFGESMAHPPLHQLVLHIDNELGGRRGRQVRRHVAQCWQCRRLCERLVQGAGLFVDRLEQEVETGPAPPALVALRRRLDALDADESPRLPRPAWFGFAAMAALLIGMLVVTTTTPTRLSAAQILARSALSRKGRRVPARHRVVLRSQHLETVEVSDGGPIRNGNLERIFSRIPLDPHDPLNPRGFLRWHDGLASASDVMAEDGDFLTITTTAQAGSFVRVGKIRMRSSDYHPLWEVMELSSSEVLEIQELGPEPVTTLTAGLATRPMAAMRADPERPVTAPAAPAARVNYDDVEIEARLALNRIEADRYFPAVFVAEESALAVEGMAETALERNRIVSVLRDIPRLVVRVRAREEMAQALPNSDSRSVIEERGVVLEPLAREAMISRFGSEDVARSVTDALQANAGELNLLLQLLADLGRRFSGASLDGLSVNSRAQVSRLAMEMGRRIGVAWDREGELRLQLFPEERLAPSAPESCLGWREWVGEVQPMAAEDERLYWRLFGTVRAKGADGMTMAEAMERLRGNWARIGSRGACAAGE